MRTLAQASMVVGGLFLVFMLKAPALILVAWYVLPPVAFFPLWYIIFDRHRETDLEQVLLRLERIANAITDAADRSATGSSFPRPAGDTVLRRSEDTAASHSRSAQAS